MKKWAMPLMALALAGCVKTPPGARIDPSLSMLIPDDTVLLAGVHVDGFQKTPVYQKHFAKRSVPLVDDFAKQTGVDPRKELWELLLISDGKRTVLLGRGKFSDEAEPRLERPGAKRFGYKGFNLIGDEREAILLVSPTVTGVGETDALKALIDSKGKSNGPPAALAALMREIPAEAAFWAAYAGGSARLPFDVSGNLANINKILGSIQSGSLYLDTRAGVNGLATGAAGTEQDAKGLHDALRALVNLGRLSIPANRPEMGRVFDGFRVTQESRTVNVHVEQPEELVDAAVNLWFGPAR